MKPRLLKASNKIRDYDKFVLGKMFGPKISPVLHSYTMLVAWHKFDRTERAALAEITQIDLSKLPFTQIGTVVTILSSYRYSRIPYPLANYRARIARAVIKHYNQSRKKERKVKRLRLNPGI